MKILLSVIGLSLPCWMGCGYQPAPMAADPYTASSPLGRDWPIGDGTPGQEADPSTYSGMVELEE